MPTKRATKKAVNERVKKEVVASNGHVELSIQEVVAMRESLIKLMQKPLPAQASFRLAQLGNVLNPHLAAFNDTRLKLIREMGAPVEGTNDYKVTDANMEDFTNQIEALGRELISVPAFKIVLPPTLEIEAMFILPLQRFLEVADG